ncbi:MAG: hypothetical protein ACREYC_05565 [Gammaproteobacteria bacterium]
MSGSEFWIPSLALSRSGFRSRVGCKRALVQRVVARCRDLLELGTTQMAHQAELVHLRTRVAGLGLGIRFGAAPHQVLEEHHRVTSDHAFTPR